MPDHRLARARSGRPGEEGSPRSRPGRCRRGSDPTSHRLRPAQARCGNLARRMSGPRSRCSTPSHTRSTPARTTISPGTARSPVPPSCQRRSASMRATPGKDPSAPIPICDCADVTRPPRATPKKGAAILGRPWAWPHNAAAPADRSIGGRRNHCPTSRPASCRGRSHLAQVVAQLASSPRMAQAAQRLALDLPDPLAGQAELLSDLLQRVGPAVVQAEAQP